MKIYGYTRVSSEEQVRRGVSHEMQADRIRAYVSSQGWKLVRIFEDAGHSGTTLARPALQKMLARLDESEESSCGRWTGSRASSVSLWRSWRSTSSLAGWDSKSITEPFDTTSPMVRVPWPGRRDFPYRSMSRAGRQTIEATAVRSIHPYVARHLFASLLIMAGKNPLYVSRQMGITTPASR